MKSIVNWIADLIFPAHCLGCSLVGTHLCPDCVATLPARTAQECIGCARLSPFGTPCTTCRTQSMVDGLWIAGQANNPLMEQAVYALKYRGVQGLAHPLANYLVSALALRATSTKLFWPNPLVIPVPLHIRRHRERGFNQSALVARHVADTIGMPMTEHALVRTRATMSQVSTASRRERIDNMKGVFACAQPEQVAGRDVVLIDDVCTTGATLQDCARALKESRANTVWAITLLRG